VSVVRAVRRAGARVSLIESQLLHWRRVGVSRRVLAVSTVRSRGSAESGAESGDRSAPTRAGLYAKSPQSPTTSGQARVLDTGTACELQLEEIQSAIAAHVAQEPPATPFVAVGTAACARCAATGFSRICLACSCWTAGAAFPTRNLPHAPATCSRWAVGRIAAFEARELRLRLAQHLTQGIV
jgi:hypothetical protein